MDVFAVTWSAGDDARTGACRITAFGKTPDGQAACVHIGFTPFFYVAVPKGFSEARCRPLMAEWAKQYEAIPEQCRVVQRRSIWGYQAGEQRPFVQLVFRSMQAFRRARYALARSHDTYEGGVDPVIRLFHLRGLGPCRWVRVARWREPGYPVADVDVEVECAFTDVAPSDRADRPPLVFASEFCFYRRSCCRLACQLGGGVGYQGLALQPGLVCLRFMTSAVGFDLECYSASGAFPVADNPDDAIIQISTAFQRYGEPEPYARTVVCLKETDPVEGVDITWHEHEHQVIESWARLLRDHKADVLLGYNTWQFDMRYIAGRCGVLVDDDTGDPLVNTELLGRMVDGGGESREFELNSGAYGDNTFFVLDTPGVQQIDMLQFIRRNYSLASYRCVFGNELLLFFSRPGWYTSSCWAP